MRLKHQEPGSCRAAAQRRRSVLSITAPPDFRKARKAKAMAPHSSTLAWKIPWMEETERAAVYGVAKSRTRLPFHFSLSCIGEGNGNPLQCSCLENPKDRGAWWASVSGVAQSRTRLKQLSSSSSSRKGKGGVPQACVSARKKETQRTGRDENISLNEWNPLA